MKQAMLTMLFLSALAGTTQAVNPQVTLHLSGGAAGTIVLELYADQAPVTVANFINYVQAGFYDGLIFHRVIKDFMIQAGGFDAGLVYKTPGPSIVNESTNNLSNLRGTLSMARGNYPHSASSQFFINHIDNPGLDFGAVVYDGTNNAYYYRPGYCVFGRVISGIEVVDAIAGLETENVTNPDGALMQYVPKTDVVIQSAVVTVEAPVCAEPLEGDINGDCRVDLEDLMLLANNWLAGNALIP